MRSAPHTALITGAARRIGACIARSLHQRGCNVILHYHGSCTEAMRLQEEFNGIRRDSVSILQADLGDIESIEHLASAVSLLTDKLDLLVNNASRFFPTKVGDTSQEQWNDLMGSNLFGPYFLTQALLSQLSAANGSVVNIVDVHAVRPMRGHVVYSMAKAGLQMMTLALARDLGPEVRVNGVAPGAILWPENDMPGEEQEKILAKTVMGKAGRPEDIASAVVYLGLDATYVTGQVLAVDGGRSLNI
ncbi:MAG: pteridine reductase [Xanthomonadales bacterium]|nr:pteridine reductase [Xanthomonadales bacterium]